MWKFVRKSLTVAIFIVWYSALYPQTNTEYPRESFKEMYSRIYMDYYVQEKYSDALSVLLRVNPANLDDSSKVDLYLLLGRIFVNLNESEKAEEAFGNALAINIKFVPPPGEWLPTEEQVFFETKEKLQSLIKRKSDERKKSLFTRTLQFIKNHSLTVIAGAGVVAGSILLLNKKDRKARDPLPYPPDFPNQ